MGSPGLRRGRAVWLPLAASVLAAAAGATAWAQGGGTPSLRVIGASVRAVDGIVVDVDASAIRNSSNLRLAVMPASSPDAVDDVQSFTSESVALSSAGRIRLTLPPGPPGQDEVRLYHIPRFASAFEVAARAPVSVGPGAPGAVSIRDLGREAAALGPIRFEATYRDRSILVQSQFLRVRPDTEWDVNWIGGVPRATASRQLAVIALGTRGLPRESGNVANEAVCVVRLDTGTALDRIAALQPGDAILIRARPSTWSSAQARDPIVLRECQIAG